MILKNYTSTVPVPDTIYRIEQVLIRAGVSGISKEYGINGQVSAITFKIQFEQAKVPVWIRMPADVEACANALFIDYADGDPLSSDGERVRARRGNKKKTRAEFKQQGERTAWKLMQDWIEVQLSMILLKQAEVAQVFLPYAWDGREMFYAKLKSGGFAALMPPRDADTTA